MQCTKLDNGLRVVTDKMDHIKTINIGVWVNVGARHEMADEHGISHMLEHMAFKGTKTRSYKDIAEQIENVGGMMNAYTGREQTAYYMRALSDDAELCADIIGDILQNSIFDEHELTQEKNVILQEIGECEDQPDDVLFDKLQEVCFPNQMLGKPILGTVQSVTNMKREQITSYIRKHYSPENMIFAASGDISHAKMLDFANKYMNFPKKNSNNNTKQASWGGGDRLIEKDLEQLHIALAFKGVSYYDDDYYTAEIFSMLYGGGMSSRLFQEIREKLGLVYSISSYTNNLSDTGSFGVYAGTDAKHGEIVVKSIFNELEKLTENITEAEIKRAKAQLRAGLLMGLESPAARCEAFVKQQFIFDKFITNDYILERIDSVTIQDLKNFGKKLLSEAKPSIAAVGNIDILSDIRSFLLS